MWKWFERIMTAVLVGIFLWGCWASKPLPEEHSPSKTTRYQIRGSSPFIVGAIDIHEFNLSDGTPCVVARVYNGVGLTCGW